MGKLTDKYCIVGVGETPYMRGSGRSTRAMAVEAVKKAIEDAGLKADGIDGIMSFGGMDRTDSYLVAGDLGIRPNFYMDVYGGGSSTEALVGLAMGAIEVGMCRTVAIFRSLNGYSGITFSATGVRAALPVTGYMALERPYGVFVPAQQFALIAMRHMREYGTTSEHLARVKVVASRAASQNPRALKPQRVTVADVLNSRYVVKPFHLLDCCIETDVAAAIIVTSAERARDLKQPPVYVMGLAGRTCSPKPYVTNPTQQYGSLATTGGQYAGPIAFGMAGIKPEDVDVTNLYDCFTIMPIIFLEDYGFCKKGEGGPYIATDIVELGGRRPLNTSGGFLSAGYAHGIDCVIENVRQLRGRADDYCPGWKDGVHSYDYSPGRCRQVKDPEIAFSAGHGGYSVTSALVLRR